MKTFFLPQFVMGKGFQGYSQSFKNACNAFQWELKVRKIKVMKLD
jgi:hypothetical protein